MTISAAERSISNLVVKSNHTYESVRFRHLIVDYR